MSRNSFLHGRTGTCAAALLITTSLLLSGCGAGAGATDAQAAEKDPKAEKAVDAVPVEAVAASRRAVAASYTGTAALEARAESQVVAKTSGVALAVLSKRAKPCVPGSRWCAWTRTVRGWPWRRAKR